MPVLPDLLAPGLVTVFCGSAVGAASARIGAPYAGPGTKFWPMLAETGPTPRRFAPQEWRKLAALGVDLALMNTVRTERLDQFPALKWLLRTLSAKSVEESGWDRRSERQGLSDPDALPRSNFKKILAVLKEKPKPPRRNRQ
jgi:hypothetical protein